MKTKKGHMSECNDVNDKSATEVCVCSVAEHTPTPDYGEVSLIKALQKTGNGTERAFIVRAVNSHDELVETLKGITKTFKKLSEKYEPDNTDAEWLAHATEAIAKAEGK